DTLFCSWPRRACRVRRSSLCMSRLPRRSTLFPYTALFRSPGQRVVLVHGSEDEVTQWQHSRHITDEATRRGLPWMLVTEPGVGHVPADADETEQRYRNVRGAVTEVLGRPAPAPQWSPGAGRAPWRCHTVGPAAGPRRSPDPCGDGPRALHRLGTGGVPLQVVDHAPVDHVRLGSGHP